MRNDIPLLIEPQDLQKYTSDKNTRIIDLCSEQSWHSGHIPNAVHVSPQSLFRGQAPAPGLLPDIPHLESLFGHLGLTPESHFFVYDDEGGGWAGRFLWTLDVIGHQHYSYINGGLLAWRGANLSIEQVSPSCIATDVKIKPNQQMIVDVQEILQKLGNENFTVWDARSPEEYRGEKVQAARGGHIPGAINCEWTRLMDSNTHFRIRQDAEEYLQTLGINKHQEIVTHCQTHHRSGFTWLVGKTLGFNIKAYPGSWSEWGNLSETPVETASAA